MSRRVFSEAERIVEGAELGALQLKGFSRPVPAYELIAVR
jgi:class 3 adenylate cyclase